MRDTKQFQANIGRTLIQKLHKGDDHKMVVTGIVQDRAGNLVYECLDQDGFKPQVSVDFADRYPGRYRWAAAGSGSQSSTGLPPVTDPGYGAAVARHLRGNQSIDDVLKTMGLIRAGAPEADIQRSAASWANASGASTGKNVPPVSNQPGTQMPASGDPRAFDAAVNDKLAKRFGIKAETRDPDAGDKTFEQAVEERLVARLGGK